MIPAEIREKLGIREGEEVEWALEGEVMVVKVAREEKTPDEILEYLKNHLVEIRGISTKAVCIDLNRQMMGEWVRRKLGLTQ